VGVAAFTDEGEPAIIGGKGPGRGNYRLVLASDYRNYGGLVHAGQGLADDDFTDPVLGTMGRQPPRHLVDSGGMLVIRFNPRQLAEWVDDVINDALKLGGSMDDRAREYAQKMAPFTTLTDEEMAALDAVGGEQPSRLRLPADPPAGRPVVLGVRVIVDSRGMCHAGAERWLLVSLCPGHGTSLGHQRGAHGSRRCSSRRGRAARGGLGRAAGPRVPR
jgi:hypothetical protein